MRAGSRIDGNRDEAVDIARKEAIDAELLGAGQPSTFPDAVLLTGGGGQFVLLVFRVRRFRAEGGIGIGSCARGRSGPARRGNNGLRGKLRIGREWRNLLILTRASSSGVILAVTDHQRLRFFGDVLSGGRLRVVIACSTSRRARHSRLSCSRAGRRHLLQLRRGEWISAL